MLGAGGAQCQLVGLAILLHKANYNVKVCTYYPHDFYKSCLDENGVKNEIIPQASNTKKRIWKVYRYFKKEKPDWVIAYQETPSLVACTAKMMGCNYNLLVSERNTTQIIGMNERARFFLYHWADAIVPNSYSQENWLINNYPWMKSRITTITNFVDLHKFAYTEHRRRTIPEIMVAASGWESKNLHGFIKACKILKDSGTKFHCTWYGLIGDLTEYQKRAIELIKNLDIEDVFTLTYKTKEIHKKYQEADYFCLPSFYEGTPNVICEAISTGLPVMCSKICDNDIYVKDDINGILFNPNDTKSISSSIMHFLNFSSDEYENQRKQSRRIAEELLTKDNFLVKYLKIIN